MPCWASFGAWLSGLPSAGAGNEAGTASPTLPVCRSQQVAEPCPDRHFFFFNFPSNYFNPLPRIPYMRNQPVVFSKILALVLPVTVGLGCGLKRDWSICAPNDKEPCLPGYVCTADLRCVLPGDGGTDGVLAVDSRGPTGAVASGGTGGGNASAGVGGGSGNSGAAGGNASSGVSGGNASAGDEGGNASGVASGGNASAGAGSGNASGGAPGPTPSGAAAAGGRGGAAGGNPSGGAGGGNPSSVAAGGNVAGSASGGNATGGVGGAKVPDAAVDAPAPTPDAFVPLAVGVACSANADCASGNCADGVCCSGPCTACNACIQTLTGKADGTCAPISSGQDPHNTCTDETASKPCGNDGACDGAGACRKVSNSKICTPASCSADKQTFTPAATCDGAGTCPAAKAQDCGAFQCATTGCLKICAAQADCDTTSYCDTGTNTCATKLSNGLTASQGYQCTSGIVADGVCCNQACTTGCSACTSALNGQASNTTGQCLPVVAGKADPHSTCTASPPCGLDGTCDGSAHCRYTAGGTSCAPASCAGSTLTTKACDGTTHTCVSSSSACANALICASATACKMGSCTADIDCVTGDYCASGTCAPKKDNGGSCSANSQCKNGNCVSNICCDSACGQCNSCATGTCTPVADLTTCGTGKVCVSGSCIACSSGTSCQRAPLALPASPPIFARLERFPVRPGVPCAQRAGPSQKGPPAAPARFAAAAAASLVPPAVPASPPIFARPERFPVRPGVPCAQRAGPSQKGPPAAPARFAAAAVALLVPPAVPVSPPISARPERFPVRPEVPCA